MKTSAVQWLFDNLTTEIPTIRRFKKKKISRNLSFDDIEKLINQAKEIEKENIIEAYVEGCEESYGLDGPNPECDDKTYAEQYYTQTFKK